MESKFSASRVAAGVAGVVSVTGANLRPGWCSGWRLGRWCHHEDSIPSSVGGVQHRWICT